MIAKCKYKYEVNHASNLFLIVKINSSILKDIYLCSKEITARVKINHILVDFIVVFSP